MMDSLKQKHYYFDHNGTTPPHPDIVLKVSDWVKDWGNPSSIHWYSRGPKALLRESRKKVADLIGCDPLEIIFTSGGSEGNSLVLQSVSKISKRKHFIFSSVEHPSIKKASEFLAKSGARVDYIPVSRGGEIDLKRYQELLSEETALVSVMLANNETGSLFPIKKMVSMAHEKGALFHTDAVQALGKIVVNVKQLDVDFATFAGHKFYSLKGVGFVYSKRGTTVEPIIYGGGQERLRRGGTENVLAIASLGLMAEKKDLIQNYYLKMLTLRESMEKMIQEKIPNVKFNGNLVNRLPNTSSFIIPGLDGETLLMNLDMLGFAVSTGAACSSGSQEPSPTLRAMGLSWQEAQSSMRVSLGWETTEEEIKIFVNTLFDVVTRLKKLNEELKNHEEMNEQEEKL